MAAVHPDQGVFMPAVQADHSGYMAVQPNHGGFPATVPAVPVQPSQGGFNSLKVPEADILEDDKIFAEVAGRLSLGSGTKKYNVTNGEIRRRIQGPENLNSSTLMGFMRNGKTKKSGEEFRKKLEETGLNLDPNNRKRVEKNSVFTCLPEQEAAEFATDLDRLVKENLPMAPTAAVRMEKNQKPIEEAKRDVEGAVRVFSAMNNMVQSLRVANLKEHPPPLKDHRLQKPMDDFSMLTHGFGIANMKTYVNYFEQLANTAQELDRAAPKVTRSVAPASQPQAQAEQSTSGEPFMTYQGLFMEHLKKTQADGHVQPPRPPHQMAYSPY